LLPGPIDFNTVGTRWNGLLQRSLQCLLPRASFLLWFVATMTQSRSHRRLPLQATTRTKKRNLAANQQSTARGRGSVAGSLGWVWIKVAGLEEKELLPRPNSPAPLHDSSVPGRNCRKRFLFHSQGRAPFVSFPPNHRFTIHARLIRPDQCHRKDSSCKGRYHLAAKKCLGSRREKVVDASSVFETIRKRGSPLPARICRDLCVLSVSRNALMRTPKKKRLEPMIIIFLHVFGISISDCNFASLLRYWPNIGAGGLGSCIARRSVSCLVITLVPPSYEEMLLPDGYVRLH
jgi:hypothetical protein